MEEKNFVDPKESQETDINFGHYLAVLLKRKWLVLAITAFAAIVAAVYCAFQTPVYQAKTSIFIDPANYSFMPDVVTKSGFFGRSDTYLNTQFKILKSRSLAFRVAQKMGLRPEDLQTPKEKKKRAATAKKTLEPQTERVASRLLEWVEISPIPTTNLCEVIFTTPNPKLSMTIANTWAEEYVDYSLAAQYENTQKAQVVLTEQIKSIKSAIDEKEKMLRDYSLAKQVVKPDGYRSMSVNTIDEINAALTAATRDRVEKGVHFNDVRIQKTLPVNELKNSSAIQELKSEQIKLEQEYAQKAKTYKIDYPEMIRIRTQLDMLKGKIVQETQELLQQTKTQAQVDYTEALNKEKASKEQLENAKRLTIAQREKELNYDALVTDIDQKKGLLRYLLQKQNDAGVSQPAIEQKATLIRIVDRAELPKDIFSPKVLKSILIGVLIGFVTSLLLVFLFEFLDRSLKTTEEVERYTNLPTLGIVPLYFSYPGNGNGDGRQTLVKREGAVGSTTTDLLVLHDSSCITSEAIRTVRTSLLLSFPERAPKSILITSSKPGEGKTFIACNLALSLTQLGKKVLLIDADLRNPRLHRIWSMRNDKGLSRILTSDQNVADVIVNSPVDGLKIITSGVRTPRPAELLASSKFQQLIGSLSESFDHIILDSPPLLPVSDAMILAGRSDCVVLVIHGGDTSRELVQRATHQLSKTEAVVAGAVLNFIDLTDPYYYYTYYSTYKSYYGDKKELPPPQA